MSTTPAEITTIQQSATAAQTLAMDLVAGQVTGGQQTTLESAACALYQAVYDLVPDPPPVTPPANAMTPPVPVGKQLLNETFANLNQWNGFYGPGSRWDVQNLGAPYSSGGTNQAAYWAPAQVTLGPSGATLSARPTVKGDVGYGKLPFVSGCLTSKTTLPAAGWVVGTRAQRCDTSAGGWPADWFLPANSAQELDGFEGGWLVPNPNTQGHSDVFASSGQKQAVWPASVDLSSGFFDYWYEFIPGNAGSVTVWCNAKQVYRFTGALSQQAYYLFLQLQIASAATKGWHTTGGDKALSQTYQQVQIYALP